MDNYFSNIDSIKILEIFGDYYPILSSFYDIGIFSLKDVIHFSVLNIKPFIYFFNEITRIRNKTEDRHDSEQLSKYEKKLYNARVEMISPDDLNFMEKISKEKYFDYINDCQNMSKLAQIIRSDRLLKFVKYISMKNINYNAKLNYSILEANSLTNNKEKMPELVEYAAYCGSHKIFTYLLEKLIKKGSVPNTLSDYACAGGHLKIVKLLNYYRFDFGESCIHNAIEYQQNEVLDYLIKEKHMEITLFSKMFCIQSMNLLEFLNLVKQNDINDDLKRRCIRKTATLYGISEIR
ncbi:hypothetical protein TRFO_16788 [Tritrichomonas foetus]|uniref:Uncharacterized protein n=1 Tax=Tritrichomonas foetus TaxID=1144522 RepID=A0A1J4KQE7_9EUKA|nr:hypothetical protein TRFO_16788 [Tritrichomonas foetus]|eukprot:OHT13136.1 hypothetical protein TRFO_16788 [Tritrichomonas foetus]